ncbi:MAG: anaerobic ribonucleoside-triphosphate reductase activating protein [Desulfobacteraceae bacterium]|nr:anaerobic ribonucleoside-triphosphate reductase activating protein [Desulfobacteraceae bacterium]
MVIGGLHKNSLIDYPGKISCVVFLSGCNFHCPYCHNPGLAMGKPDQIIPETRLFEFLEKRRSFLDGVVITGGEPTLSPELAGLCERIHSLGYSIKLDTNGSRPEILNALIELSLVDYIAMDIKTEPSGYTPDLTTACGAEPILDSIDLLKKAPLPYEFRTTCVSPFINETIIRNIGRTIKGAATWALQPYEAATVLNIDFFNASDPAITRRQLNEYQLIASAYVDNCIVR